MVSAISYQGVYSEAEKSKKFAVKSSKMFENHLPAFQRAVRAVRMKKETSKPMNFIFCPDDSMTDCGSLCATLGKAFNGNRCPEINKILSVQRFVVNY